MTALEFFVYSHIFAGFSCCLVALIYGSTERLDIRARQVLRNMGLIVLCGFFIVPIILFHVVKGTYTFVKRVANNT